MADRDFAQVTGTPEHPLFLECRAYSSLHLPVTEKRTRAWWDYTQLWRLGAISPELKLNWAYAIYLEKASAWSPATQRATTYVVDVWIPAIQRANAAVDADRESQRGYHLRAFIFYKAAYQDFKSAGTDDTSETYVKRIDSAIEDYEHALTLGPMNLRLCVDMAIAYAQRDQDSPSDRLKELFQTAVDLGASKASLASIGRPYSWRDAEWHVELQESCDPAAGIPPNDGRYFLTPPDYKAVERYLRRIQPILAKPVHEVRSKDVS